MITEEKGIHDMNDAKNYNDALCEEISFWDRELSLEGEYKDFIMKRIDPVRRREEYPSGIFDRLTTILDGRFPGSRPFKVIELGSGPLSTLAHGVDKGDIEVHAVDILADSYADLYKKYNLLDFPVKPVSGTGESLSEIFERASFHCAYVRNALDHTFDIVRSFNNLVSLVKKGGYIVLQHNVREGSGGNWKGIHGWDLDFNEHGLIASNSIGQEFRLQQNADMELSIVHYSSIELDRWVECVFKKN